VDVKNAFAPTFRIEANDTDITATIAKYFSSLTLTDTTGTTSDVLEITLADTDPLNPIEIPPKGAELRLFLGYGSELADMGMYVRDEVELAGWPGEMVIRARAAIYDKTPAGKTDMQTQKTRSWPKGTKLGDMAAKVAKDHNMTAVVSPVLAKIVLPHISQSDESDINLLVRIAKKYDAVAKPAGGKIILAKRGESKSASGQDIPSVTITPDMGGRYRYVESARETAGTVVAYWHAVKQAKRHEIKVGTGEPVKRLKMYYPTSEMALAAARAELDKRERGQETISLDCVGNTDIQAEATIVMSGWRPGLNGDWIATHVVHTVTSSGYTCSVELEKPNADGTPNASDTADNEED
jgi:phage protein D